jgi:hypothetical protein
MADRTEDKPLTPFDQIPSSFFELRRDKSTAVIRAFPSPTDFAKAPTVRRLWRTKWRTRRVASQGLIFAKVAQYRVTSIVPGLKFFQIYLPRHHAMGWRGLDFNLSFKRLGRNQA